jgi:cell shape-determining protein MreC
VPEETTPVEGTPSTPEAPNWDSPDNPYLKRFQDTQASYTQNQQELARLKALEQDQQAYIELGKQQGWIEVEDPNAVNDEFLDPRLAQMIERDAAREERLAQLEQRAQAEELEASREQFRDNNAAWAKEAGVEFDKADHAAVCSSRPTTRQAWTRISACSLTTSRS